jgi:hypothetical protein
MEFNLISTLGYEYPSLSLAEADRDTINTACYSPTATTTEYATIIPCAVNEAWFIVHQDYMTQIIGEPQAIEFYTPKSSPFNT